MPVEPNTAEALSLRWDLASCQICPAYAPACLDYDYQRPAKPESHLWRQAHASSDRSVVRCRILVRAVGEAV